MRVTRDIIENIIGTRPQNMALYQRALTHKSALKCPHNADLTHNNETLEFLGDSCLSFVISKWLFDRYESRQEGFLTRARTKLVRSETLASIAESIGLSQYILMDDKAHRNGWENNSKVREDAMEALIGAVYLDLGMVHAKKFILDLFDKHVDMNTIFVDNNFKDHLMRYTQTNGLELPDYRANQVDGLFVVDVYVQGSFCGRGKAKSKKAAEQNAAKAFFYPNLKEKATVS